ncbi:MAG: hypothetical protein ABJA67_16890, partial [Chthonomonadales bacterium]
MSRIAFKGGADIDAHTYLIDEIQSQWPRCPESAELLNRLYEEYVSQNPLVRTLEQKFLSTAGVDIRNLLD